MSKLVVCTDLNCNRQSFLLVYAITGYLSIFAFASLVCIAIGIASSEAELKICVIIAKLKKCKSIIKNERTKT